MSKMLDVQFSPNDTAREAAAKLEELCLFVVHHDDLEGLVEEAGGELIRLSRAELDNRTYEEVEVCVMDKVYTCRIWEDGSVDPLLPPKSILAWL